MLNNACFNVVNSNAVAQAVYLYIYYIYYCYTNTMWLYVDGIMFTDRSTYFHKTNKYNIMSNPK